MPIWIIPTNSIRTILAYWLKCTCCCQSRVWAHEQINMETHWDFVRTNFSGVLCLDEVHDSGRTMLFATDPLGDFTVSFNVVDKNDPTHMDRFLQARKDRGLNVEVVITEGSP